MDPSGFSSLKFTPHATRPSTGTQGLEGYKVSYTYAFKLTMTKSANVGLVHQRQLEFKDTIEASKTSSHIDKRRQHETSVAPPTPARHNQSGHVRLAYHGVRHA
ncbi:hypothetical protein H257_08037 [Aphanomyces astaci]|uniref:Uncharacterized protein n=1 Tax=Aphanomyces astaci TaxID=112090 RepID=W4GFQ4_APHAT|nr:hypothetical protein H257_08037 [Aphanomyces astaci]ETV78522.1 hypothetical protein H257_08037 [Aphanomyces astaci]|eukprot:XP_009832103.1 hypothetical protein H257_08037 [Aphanomyces astaci]